MSIILFNGNWQVKLNTRDPLYSDFFSNLTEAAGSLPSRLEVPSDVARQWSSWEEVLDWMYTGSKLFLASTPWYIRDLEPVAQVDVQQYMQDNPEYVEGMSFADQHLLVIRGEIRAAGPSNIEPDTLRSTYRARVVLLSEVNYITVYLVNQDVPWRYYVQVDSSSHYHDRLEHYRWNGLYIRTNRIVEMQHSSHLPYEELYHDFSTAKDPIYQDLTPEQRDRALAIEWLTMAHGIRHNALITLVATGDRPAGDVPAYLIPWGDVIDMIGVDWLSYNPSFQAVFTKRGGIDPEITEKILQNAEVTSNTKTPVTYYLLAGRQPREPVTSTATITATTTDNHLTWGRVGVRLSRKGSPLEVNLQRLDLIYNNVIDALWNVNLTANQLGINVILPKGRYRDLNRELDVEVIPATRAPEKSEYYMILFDVMTLIHLTVLLVIPRSKLDSSKTYTEIGLNKEDFPEAIELVSSHLGTKTLELMARVLLDHHGDNDQAMEFVTLVVEYLERQTESTGFSHLP